MDDAELAALARTTQETGAVASHGTAAQLWQLRLQNPPPRPTVTVARDRSKVTRTGFHFRRGPVRPDDVWWTAGIAVTGPLQTVLDNARTLPLAEGVVVADSALQSRLVIKEALDDAARLAVGPGSARIRRVAALADGRSMSVPETLVSVMLVGRAELGAVVPQFCFAGRKHPYDLALPDLCLVIEFQSWEFHGERSVWKLDATWGNEAYTEGWGYLQLVWEDVVAGVDHIAALIARADPRAEALGAS